jgi:hypothetical protein
VPSERFSFRHDHFVAAIVPPGHPAVDIPERSWRQELSEMELCYDGPTKPSGDPVSVGNEIFLRGVDEFNRGEFFAAHETWEAIWLVASGRDKVFLQGNIQLAAAFHHWKNGNQRGTLSLLRRALAKLAEIPGSYRGIRVGHLREQAELWKQALAANLAPPDAAPKIEFESGSPAEPFAEATGR